MKIIITLACLFCASFALHAQCTTATWLECSQLLLNETTSSTSGFSISNYSNCSFSPGNNFQGRDKVYRFELIEQTDIVINVRSISGQDLGLILLDNCSPVNCIDYQIDQGGYTSLSTSLPAGLYYIVVENMGSGSATYDIDFDCACTCASGQGNRRLCENFEEYNLNDNITANSPVRWKKWSTTSNDAVIAQAGGSQQLRMRSATNFEPDIWMNLFNPSGASVTTGRYRLSFNMTVAPGKVGIYHVFHAAPNANGANSNKAYKVSFYSEGTGTLTLGNIAATAAYFSYTVGAPTDVMQILDLDNNVAELWINHEFIYSWSFDIGSAFNSNALSMLNFDAHPSQIGNQAHDYTIDDICFMSPGIACEGFPIGDEVCIKNGQQYNYPIEAVCDLYDIDLESQPCPTPCDNATWLECSQMLVNQDFAGVSNFSTPDYNGCVPGPTDIYQTEDRIYKFELKEETEVTIMVESTTFDELALFLLDNCSPTHCTDFSSDPSGYHSLTRTLSPGVYYVVVEDQAAGFVFFKQFNITLSCGCSCQDDVYGNSLHCENFESYLPDDQLSANSNRWHTWNSIQDDVPVLENAGNQSIRIANSGTVEPDIWMDLFPASEFPVEDGRYRLSFDMTVAEGNAASYYVHHVAPNTNGAGQNIAYRVVFNSNGSGSLVIGNQANPPAASFGYVPGATTNVMQILDLNYNISELWINHEFIHSWAFNMGVDTSGALADINFDAHPGSLGGQDFDYTIDNLCFISQYTSWSICQGISLPEDICIKNGEQYYSSIVAACDLYNVALESVACQHICDYGGTMIYRGETYAGTLDISDKAPPLLKYDACIQAAYNVSGPQVVSAGTTMPSPLYSDVYVFYNESGGPMYFHFNNNGNPTTKCFVYSCYYGNLVFESQSDTTTADRSGFCIREPHCYGEIFPGDSTYAIGNYCSDYYYVVVTGAQGSSYSGLSITPPGPCPRNPPVITCGQTLLNQTITGAANPTFSTVGVNGKAYDHCYTGLRNYSGAEKIYKFVLDEPKNVTITLNATPTNSPMGFFVYNFICGLMCMDYAENTTSDPKAVRSLLLNEGTYYIVVDKATTAGANGFSLSLDCDDFTSFPDITRVLEATYDFCPPDPNLLHEVGIHNNAHSFAVDDKIMFRYLNEDGYYLTNPNLTEIWGPSIQTVKTIPLQGDNTLDQKCSYAIGDTFLITVFQTENGQNRFTEYIADYLPGNEPGVNATNTFENLGKSLITNLRAVETGSKNFILNPTEFSVTDTSSTSIELKITTNNEEVWKVKKEFPADWLTLEDTLGIGQDAVTLFFDTNFTEIRRTAFLRFSLSSNPGFYRRFIKVTQKGKCNPNPVLNVTATPQLLCGAGDAMITANVGPGMDNMFTYKWSTGQTGKSIPVHPDMTKTYTVTITNIDCFVTKTATATVTVNTPPPQPLNPVHRTICQGYPLTQPLAVSLPPGTNQIINWYGQPAGGSILFGGANTTTYSPSVLQTDTFYAETKNTQTMCVSVLRTPVVLTVNPVPSLTVAQPLCAPDRSYSLTASTDNNNGAYLTANAGTVTLANGVYTISQIPNGATVIVTAHYGGNNTCTTTSPPITKSCDCPPMEPPVPAQDSPLIVCENDEIPDLEVIVNPGLKVYWYITESGGDPLPGGSDTPLFHASETGTYYAEARNPVNGCSSERLAVSLEIIPAPVLEFVDTLCHINLMTGSTYTARFRSSVPDPIALTGQLSGPVNGIYTLDNVPVGTDIQLFADAGSGCFTDFLIESPQCACPAIAPPSNPVDAILCADETITPLHVTPPSGYLVDWFNQALSGEPIQGGINTPVFYPMLPGVYFAGARDAATGCRSAARTQVRYEVNELPQITLDSTVCVPVTERYSIYFHSNGDVVNTSYGLPVASGNGGYYLQHIPAGTEVTLSAFFTVTGCDRSQIVTEEGCFCPPMDAPVSAGDQTICEGDDYPALTATVGPGQQAQWYNAANELLATGNVYVPQLPGTYFVRPVDVATSCIGNVAVEVSLTVRQAPVVQAGTDQIVCAANNVILSGSVQGASSGVWTSTIPGGVFVPNNSVNAAYYYPPGSAPSDYLLILTSSGAETPCPNRSDTVAIHVNPLPTFSIDTFYCAPNLQTGYLVFGTNATGVSTNSAYNIVPIAPQLYRLSITDIADYGSFTINLIAGNCLKPVTIPANFFTCNCSEDLLPPSLPDSVDYCNGDALPVLQPAVAAGLILKWYELPFSGEPIFTGNVFPVPGPDYYYVETYDSVSNCRSARRLVIVAEHPRPDAFAGQDTTICPGTKITLHAQLSPIGQIYQWSSAANPSPNIDVAPFQNTTYTLTVVSAFGCSSTDAVQVSVWPELSGTIEQLADIQCHGALTGSLKYHTSGGTSPFTYHWSTEATSDQIGELGADDYFVTVTDDHNCRDTAFYEMVEPEDIILVNSMIVYDTSECLGSIMIEIGGGVGPPYAYTWNWITTAGQTHLEAFDNMDFVEGLLEGVYKVDAQDQNGCIFSASFSVVPCIPVEEADLRAFIHVAPNPTTGILHVKMGLPFDQKVNLTVSDLLGRQLMHQQTQVSGARDLVMDLSDLPAAMYLLTVQMENVSTTYKISLQK